MSKINVCDFCGAQFTRGVTFTVWYDPVGIDVAPKKGKEIYDVCVKCCGDVKLMKVDNEKESKDRLPSIV